MGLSEQKTFLGICTANHVFYILTSVILMCSFTGEGVVVTISFTANYAAVQGRLHSVSCRGLRASPSLVSEGCEEEPAVCVG